MLLLSLSILRTISFSVALVCSTPELWFTISSLISERFVSIVLIDSAVTFMFWESVFPTFCIWPDSLIIERIEAAIFSIVRLKYPARVPISSFEVSGIRTVRSPSPSEIFLRIAMSLLSGSTIPWARRNDTQTESMIPIIIETASIVRTVFVDALIVDFGIIIV